MTVRVRLLAFGLVALLAAAVLVPCAAWASEPEDPFWKVAGARLEAASQKASIKNVSGVKTILAGKIAATEVEIRCETGALAEGTLEGSQAKQPGKASGTLELAECKLFSKVGEKFTEQPECKVSPIKSGKLSGTLWLEGTKAAAETAAVVVFEPKELTEGKPVVAKVVIEGCATFKGTRTLEGSFALKLVPQNEEFTFIQWALPETAIKTAWLPPSQENVNIGLKLEANAATLKGEMKTELASQEKFGGGTNPTVAVEAPFWGVGGKRLGAGEEMEVEDAAGETSLSWKIKGIEVETRCASAKFKEPKIIGSLDQHDGRFSATALEFSECKLFAKEAGKFVEQVACEVAPPTINKVVGKLWLKGTAAAHSTTPLLVIETDVFSGGKPILSEESVKNKGAEKCGYLIEKYLVEGALLFRLNPESVEAQIVNLSVTESSSMVWQSAEQQGELQKAIYHGGELLNIKITNIPIKLKTGSSFGGGSAGIGEIGFETNTGKISGPIKKFPEVMTFTPAVEASALECKSTGVPAGAWVIQAKTTTKEGRQEGVVDGPHEWLQIKNWGTACTIAANPVKVTCNIQVARDGTFSIYPLGTAGTTGCEMLVGAEAKRCLIKIAVEGNKGLAGVTFKNLGVNEVEIGSEVSGITSTTEEGGELCLKLKVKGGKEGKFKAKPFITEGQKLT